MKIKMMIVFSVWAVLFWCAAVYGAEEDSLRSALSALDKRQRYLSRYGDNNALSTYAAYTGDGDRDLEFLGADYNPYYKTTLSDRTLLQYLQGDDLRRNDFIKRSISSPFRERIEEDREKQREQFTKFLINAMSNKDNDGVIYGEIIDDFTDKYPNRKKSQYYYPHIETARKRTAKHYYYRQPEDASSATAIYALSYLPRDNVVEDERVYFTDGDQKLENTAVFAHHKRFPVSKRSSNSLRKRSPTDDETNNKSKSPKKTDPKVEKELSSIFGGSSNNKQTKNINNNNNSNNKPKSDKNKKKKTSTKEIALPPVFISKSEPLEIKKKSIDWSDYFGLDRRKKSDSNELDKEWLMERYHKAISMTSKRSSDYPLQHFHNHDQPQNNRESQQQQQPQQESIENNKSGLTTEEAKIKDIDEKLKNIEDTIVDDALKYTGAHEGAVDSKEIQQVKDKVISRLAAAYSLEKMRRALGEYKQSVAKERATRLKQAKNSEDTILTEEKKRVSVPRKQAVDEEAEKLSDNLDDNNIRCKDDGQCDTPNIRIPTKMLDQFQWGIEECPIIQHECSDLSASSGKYGRTFEMACNMYQLCLLCSDNNWFAPTVHCNALYLSKSNEICGGNAECLKVAKYFLDNLLLLNRSIRDRDFSPDGCNLICPENEQ